MEVQQHPFCLLVGCCNMLVDMRRHMAACYCCHAVLLTLL
jgi:hypothetical protein